jgi:hypothetical protein
MNMATDAAPLKESAAELGHDMRFLEDKPSIFGKIEAEGGDMSIEDINAARLGVGDAVRRGAIDRNVPQWKRLASLYEPLDAMEDKIIEHAGERGHNAVMAAREMRATKRAMHKAAPAGTQLEAGMIWKGGKDVAHKVMAKVFQGDYAAEEVKLIRKLLTGPGEQIHLRRAAVNFILKPDTPRTARAAMNALLDAEPALTEALGKRGVAALKKNLKAVSEGARGDLIFSPRMPKGRDTYSQMSTFLLMGMGVGGTQTARAGGEVSMETMAATAVPAAVYGVWQAFQSRFGKEALANLALTGLIDVDIRRMLEMGAKSASNTQVVVNRIAKALVDRGHFTAEELQQ